jgi:hypothetical protein
MSVERRDDLKAFRDFVDLQLSNGGVDLTPDQCLDLWQVVNPTDEEHLDTLAAIRQGLDDADAGRVRPAREVLQELLRKFNIPAERS